MKWGVLAALVAAACLSHKVTGQFTAPVPPETPPPPNDTMTSPAYTMAPPQNRTMTPSPYTMAPPYNRTTSFPYTMAPPHNTNRTMGPPPYTMAPPPYTTTSSAPYTSPPPTTTPSNRASATDDQILGLVKEIVCFIRRMQHGPTRYNNGSVCSTPWVHPTRPPFPPYSSSYYSSSSRSSYPYYTTRSRPYPYPTRPPPSPYPTCIVQCNFDRDYCYPHLTQRTDDNFNWSWQSGSTSSQSTGPKSDRSGRGKYMYIETSSPRRYGDKAVLDLKIPRPYASACLSFWYHMYGVDIQSLTVTAKYGSSYPYYRSGSRYLWGKTGQVSDNWLRAQVQLPPYTSVVQFTGVRGRDFKGDIAIDDITVHSGACSTRAPYYSPCRLTPPPTPSPAPRCVTGSSYSTTCPSSTLTLGGCKGYVAYPGYGTYNTYKTCRWRIQVPPGRGLKVTFSRMSLRHSTSCMSDYVYVNTRRYCGTSLPSTQYIRPTQYTSQPSSVYITFRSSYYNTYSSYRGFALRYEVVY